MRTHMTLAATFAALAAGAAALLAAQSSTPLLKADDTCETKRRKVAYAESRISTLTMLSNKTTADYTELAELVRQQPEMQRAVAACPATGELGGSMNAGLLPGAPATPAGPPPAGAPAPVTPAVAPAIAGFTGSPEVCKQKWTVYQRIKNEDRPAATEARVKAEATLDAQQRAMTALLKAQVGADVTGWDAIAQGSAAGLQAMAKKVDDAKKEVERRKADETYFASQISLIAESMTSLSCDLDFGEYRPAPPPAAPPATAAPAQAKPAAAAPAAAKPASSCYEVCTFNCPRSPSKVAQAIGCGAYCEAARAYDSSGRFSTLSPMAGMMCMQAVADANRGKK